MSISLRRFLPLFLICFLLSYNYYILKTLKDTLVITAEGSGAEAIPFVKVWLLLPASFLLAMMFTWLANHFSLKTVFYIVMGVFLGFYALFTFVLYPYQEHLHLHSLADTLQTWLPPGWKGFVAMIRYWSFSLFYVMAECWSSIVYAVLFWGLANEVTPLEEAEAHYPPLMLAGNLSAIAAGFTSMALASWGALFSYSEWETSLFLLTFILLLCGVGCLVLFHWAFSLSLSLKEKQKSSSDEQLTFWQALKLLFRSKPLLSLAALVFAFNLIVNLAEVEWKNQVVALYSDPMGYNTYMNQVTIAIGVISTLFTLFLCTPMLRWCGWKVTALFTPVITLVSGMLFFGFLWMEWHLSFLEPFLSSWGISSLTLGVLLGSIHVCLMRSGKYTLFDTTKEMAFISLPSDERLKGKAAVDGVGSRLGKGASSVVYQGLLIALPTITACTPYVGVIVVGMLGVCIQAIVVLSGLFREREKGVENLAL